MFRRWRIIALGIVLVLLVIPLNWYGRRTLRAPEAVSSLPAGTQESALAALNAGGYTPVAPPVWAGAQPVWRSPGDYRLFFAAPSASGGVDIHAAEARIDATGRVSRLSRVTWLTDTPHGDEAPPLTAGNWLAFATWAAGHYQAITCIPLNDLQRRELFVFAQPVEEVELSWQAAPTGRGVQLEVTVIKPSRRTTLTIDPVALHVEPDDSDLTYVPAVRGEFSWLPNLVSRIRELPGVGPEKIAFIENVFFTLLDRMNRWWYALVRPAPASEDIAPTASPAPIESSLLPPTPPPMHTPSPVKAEATFTSAPPDVRLSLPLTPSPMASFTPTPRPTPSPTPTPTSAGQRLAEGLTKHKSIRPDPQRPYAEAELLEIDPGSLQIKMIPGTWEPRSTTGLVGTGVIPREDWPVLVAAFNGGFAAMHGQYGMMVDRKVYLPPRDGLATLAVYEDGSIRMGTWGKDLTQTPDMVSYRQNCPPLIENGMITAETGKLALWGLSVSDEVYLYRSALGMTADGRLIYVVGKPLSAYTLARAMQMAGVHYAMQLDVDEFHVVFITYDVQPGQDKGQPTVTGRKLRNDMHGFEGFFLRPFQLDFFYLTRRPQRLANAVRMTATPQRLSTAPTPLYKELPGQIAFASNRDGNWELYVMKAGQPATIRRLTNHPADDLFPSWSPDGRQLAFTSRRDGNAEIYILDMSTGQVRRVTQQPSEEWAPVWSPDGKYLAYQSDRNGQSDIYVCPLDGSDERRLTPMTGNHEAPHWSPDGRLFVFDSDMELAGIVSSAISIYTMSADGAGHRRILANGEFPRWSPDGRMIAFMIRSVQWQVFLSHADGTGQRQLTSGNYDARYPAWSPDGRWLAFAGNQEGHWELYALPRDGGQPLRLTFDLSDSSYPAWGP